jgi:hypothetical protein
MDQRLHAEITVRLTQDYGFKQENGYLRKGECPRCAKKEYYTHAEHPWVLRCGRLEKCGFEEHVKEVYADLFESWSDRYPQQPAAPNAAADAYLRECRGFDLAKIEGWYSQEHYWNPELELGSATVRFALPGIGYWERLIDRPQRFGKRKATFRGEYQGAWWQPPSLSLQGVEELWITEGIFDAIALLHNGVAAVSSLSCYNYPEVALAALGEQMPLGRPRLVFAFDTGKAGERFTKQFVRRAIEAGWEATAAQPPHNGGKKLDWNDLHQRGRLSAKDLEEYRYYGALLLASSPYEKARLMYSRHGWGTFAFEHDKRLYWWKLDIDKQAKVESNLSEREENLSREEREELVLQKSNSVTEICNCLPVPLYNLKNEVTDEAWYYFRIDFPHDGPSVKNTFTAGQLAAAAEFKKRLLHIGAGAIWTGTASQLDRLLSRWTYQIKTVQTIDYIGYSLDHKAYVFNQVAVHGQQVVELNDEDYFDLGKLAIKSLSRSLKLDLNTDLKACRTDWFDKFYLCFGPRGIVALAYWLGSLFAEQIRDQFESFPFIEIVGEAGAGKTTMLETMWKLLGRSGYEGFDPMKGSQVGFLRSMAQVANLPVVLIESDREEDPDSARGRPKSAFHWDSLKSLYNGGSLRTTGVKSSGNDTYEPQFRGALVISQNAPVQASTPIMERIVHVYLDKSRQSDAGREAALELGRIPAKEISGFLLKAVTHDTAVLDMMQQRQRPYEEQIRNAGARNQRIHKNYAQLMVLVDALSLACPITASQQAEAKQLLVKLALERELSLAKDHPIVEAFWEAYDYLNCAADPDEGGGQLNHARSSDLIAINLNHFVQLAAERKQQVPAVTDLKRFLRTSRHPKFVDVGTVNSRINQRWNSRVDNPEARRPESVRCWIFEATRDAARA